MANRGLLIIVSSSDRNADGKSFVNPQTGIKSAAYQRFTDPISNGVRGGFDIHIYYNLDKPGEAQYAQDLWERIRRECMFCTAFCLLN